MKMRLDSLENSKNNEEGSAVPNIRRELEPSTLNGDAHHSLSGRVELRIWPLLIIKHPTPQSRAEAAKEVMSQECLVMGTEC